MNYSFGEQLIQEIQVSKYDDGTGFMRKIPEGNPRVSRKVGHTLGAIASALCVLVGTILVVLIASWPNA